MTYILNYANLSIAITKKTGAFQCDEHRTISLMIHAARGTFGYVGDTFGNIGDQLDNKADDLAMFKTHLIILKLLFV